MTSPPPSGPRPEAQRRAGRRPAYGARRARWLLGVAAVLAGSGVRADPGYGVYEQHALELALQNRGLVVDPAPAGKRVGSIVVHNLPVFLPGSGPDNDGWLAWLNIFHRTTREAITAREVLLRPGQPWEDELAQETRRRLTDETLTSLVVIAPVVAAAPGTVDVLVVTRDVWSLRLNTDFEYQAGTLSHLLVQPAENNLFGWRKTLSLVFDRDLGRTAIGPTYTDRNIAGTHLRLYASARALAARDGGGLEGSSSDSTLSYPFWSFRQRWGAALTVQHFRGTQRRFLGPLLRPFDDPATPEVEAVPWRYRLEQEVVKASSGWSWGRTVLHRPSLEYEFRSVRPQVFADDFAGAPPGLVDDFSNTALPRRERTSAVGVRYALLTTVYAVLRDVDTFDLAEDFNLGPNVSAGVYRGLPALGSQRAFWRGDLTVGWGWASTRYGLARLAAGGETRRQDDTWIDNRGWVDVDVASPLVGRMVRLVTRSHVERLSRNGQTRSLLLGGDTGLRGYPIGAFFGRAFWRSNTELRSASVRLLVPIGVVLFWDAGDAAPSFAAMQAHQDVGAGLRVLLPQLQRSVIRVDWAFATSGIGAGFPGRLSAGFSQAF